MKFLIGILSVFILSFCSTKQRPTLNSGNYHDIKNFQPKDTLHIIFDGEKYELGEPFGYENQFGDTIIPFGKYAFSFTDTIIAFGIVIEKNNPASELIAIDQNGKKLFEVFRIDNGPDYIKEGLFRILRNGKIGYADSTGKIIIKPQFECAYPFENGKAKVTFECRKEEKDGHKIMKSDSWFYIDKSGKKLNN